MYITSFIRCIIDNLAISFYFSLSLNCKIELLNQQIYFSHFLYLRLFFTIFSTSSSHSFNQIFSSKISSTEIKI